jgi:uncharacterized membrane protein required for colicin V production
MIRTVVVVIVIAFIAAYFFVPDSLNPWKEAASHAGEVTGNVVRSAGNAVNKAMQDEAHKDNLIDKTKDRIKDAVTNK